MTRRFLTRDEVITHPLRAGLLWAALTVPLTLAILIVTGMKAFSTSNVLTAVLLVFVAGPAFGYLLRWAYLREDADAR